MVQKVSNPFDRTMKRSKYTDSNSLTQLYVFCDHQYLYATYASLSIGDRGGSINPIHLDNEMRK